MGYHISIVRKKGKEVIPISKQEWEEFVKKSSLLLFEKLDDGKTYAVSKDSTGQIKGWLAWCNGEIWTKEPEDDFLEKMIQAASQLQARVRGDEGEYYKEVGKTYYDPLDEEEQKKVNKETKALIKRTRVKNIILNSIIFIFFVLIALIIRSCSR